MEKKVLRRERWLIHHLKVIYLLGLFLKNMSNQKIYSFCYCVVNGELPSSSPQIVEKIEVIQEAVLPGISKLNYSALDKKQGEQKTVPSKKRL